MAPSLGRNGSRGKLWVDERNRPVNRGTLTAAFAEHTLRAGRGSSEEVGSTVPASYEGPRRPEPCWLRSGEPGLEPGAAPSHAFAFAAALSPV